MPELSLTVVEGAFQPAKEIDSPDKFAGRKQQLQDAYFALLNAGSNIAIVGNRGIGKTSLARQVVNIARGNNALLEKLGLEHDAPLDYLSFYFACGSSISTASDLLERLLTTTGCLADWVYDIPGAKKAVESYNPSFFAEGGIPGLVKFKGGLGATKTTEADSAPAVSSHAIDTVFTNVLSSMAKEKLSKNGLLIVIDEFDQIKDPSGFAGLLKSLATNCPEVKFCLVGVAQDIQNLMKEHQSADRLFAGSIVPVPPMDDPALKEIVDIAEVALERRIQFNDGARETLLKLAKGHPYMVHLIGKYALRSAYIEKVAVVDSSRVDDALRGIAERGADPVLEGRYKKAISSSPSRETVLKAMANCQQADGEIHTTAAYQMAVERGVDNPGQYVGQLVVDGYGAEIAKVRERYYRFKDSLFHAYVSARPRYFKMSSESAEESGGTLNFS